MISGFAISDAPISGDRWILAQDICHTGALGAFALGSIPLAGTCDEATPAPDGEDICQTGSLGAFALGVVSLSGNTCLIEINPAVAQGGAAKLRRPWIIEQPTETDDEEVIVLVAQALVMYAHTR